MSLRAFGRYQKFASRMLAVAAAVVVAVTGTTADAKKLKTDEGGYHPAIPTDLYARIPFKGQERKYLVHLPPAYDGRTPTPLVVCLHGGGGDIGFARRMFGMSEKADKEGFIVAYPNGSGRLKDHILTWNAGECCGYAEARRIDDVSFLRNFIRQVETDYNIDRQRVYLVGFSLGAMMAYRYACEMPDDITACAIIGGSMNGKEKLPVHPVPMLIIHGLADKHVPVQGGGGKLAKWGFNVHAMPLDYAIDFWVKADRCESAPRVERNGIVERKIYPHGKDGTEVVVYTIDGYAHSWPGGKRAWFRADKPCPDLSATDTAWDFFSRHTRNPEALASGM